ncbi:MAG: hypothetical protein CVT73_08060 [Alphaproteobacteria bacterium HGW-Alphaproteobacteria-12]|nr:MAG: hypothetical protein CVT73_08060 [Alphaproteobacteria bacterium HGW-Alphaproteobacteria-12]
MSYREIDIIGIPERHPARCFRGYWKSQASAGTPPLRSRINPADIASILPWLLVLETLRFHDKLEFRYRLAGTGCTELFGMDYTGKILGENLTPEGAEIRRREFDRVIETSTPIFSTTKLPIKAKDYITVHRGVFPISVSGCAVDQIFVVVAPIATECSVRLPLSS